MVLEETGEQKMDNKKNISRNNERRKNTQVVNLTDKEPTGHLLWINI